MSRVTKNALAASLKKLVATRPLDKVTIKDITDDCGVNRMTFYYHFKDIYDLLEWIFQKEAREALSEGGFTYTSWQEGFKKIFLLIRQNDAFFYNIYHSAGKAHVEAYIFKLMQQLIRDVVAESARGKRVTEEDIDFIAGFYKYAFAGMVIDWFNDGMKEDPAEITSRLSKGLQGSLDLALNNMSA